MCMRVFFLQAKQNYLYAYTCHVFFFKSPAIHAYVCALVDIVSKHKVMLGCNPLFFSVASIWYTQPKQVMSVSIKRDRATGKNLGYGFVKMSSHQEARTAKEAMQVTCKDMTLDVHITLVHLFSSLPNLVPRPCFLEV